MLTPASKGIKKRTVIRPEGGWKERTYYICNVAFSSHNVIHKAIFYTGFLSDNGEPQGYNGFVNGSGYEDGAPSITEAYYVKPLTELMDDKMTVINKSL